MNRPRSIQLILAFFVAGIFSSCGGGGGDVAGIGGTGGGIGGTGYSASGTIDGFGSIFVNGIEFETDTAIVTIDGVTGADSALRLGMVVTVVGTLAADGVSGTASSVRFNDEVQGPVSAISVNPDGNEKTLTILGISIQVTRGATVFDDVSFDTLAINDLIEVSGLVDAASLIQATRVEKKGDFIEGISEVELKGTVSGLSATRFSLGAVIVDFSSADLSDLPARTVTSGLDVEAKGTLTGFVLTASEIELQDDLFESNQEGASLEGFITDFASISNFKISGQLVNATGAVLNPPGLQLQNGIQVKVEGEVVNGVLLAREIESRSSEIKLRARVQSVDIANGTGTIVLGFAAGNVSFMVDQETESEDETDSFEGFSVSDIRTGDFLEVQALMNGPQIVATELRLREIDDELIEGPVDQFVSNNEITLLGITYRTAGASFENANDQPISGAAFYSVLGSGDTVKIEDKLPADGIADEVEFED